jgi:hypothetical protein
MTTRKTTAAPVLADPVSADLKTLLRALKLGKLLDTLPERLTLARAQQLPHADFLELVLADEVTRRDTSSAALRARAAGLDPGMRLDTWDNGLIVERHRKAATVLTSNREPNEWLALMADPLLAQSAVDRLVSTCHELVVEGDSYRRRQRPTHGHSEGQPTT